MAAGPAGKVTSAAEGAVDSCRAAFPVHQQAQLAMMNRDGADATVMTGFDPTVQADAFHLDSRFRPSAMALGLDGSD